MDFDWFSCDCHIFPPHNGHFICCVEWHPQDIKRSFNQLTHIHFTSGYLPTFWISSHTCVFSHLEFWFGCFLPKMLHGVVFEGHRFRPQVRPHTAIWLCLWFLNFHHSYPKVRSNVVFQSIKHLIFSWKLISQHMFFTRIQVTAWASHPGVPRKRKMLNKSSIWDIQSFPKQFQRGCPKKIGLSWLKPNLVIFDSLFIISFI